MGNRGAHLDGAAGDGVVHRPLYILDGMGNAGHIRGVFFWGAIGGPAFAGIAIAWVMNAIVYGTAAFGVLTGFKLLTRALPK
jgi:hypothetical protein